MEPLFLPAASGQRFCLFHGPTVRAKGGSRGVVYVPPFAEEMNKARRMASLQARRLAEQGIAVAAVDLLGTGDSSGEQILTQFLRLKLAGQMLAGGGVTQGGTRELRAALAAGQSLEIAGYELSPALATAIDRLSLIGLTPPHGPVHWFDVAAQPAGSIAPAGQRVIDAWRPRGIEVHARAVAGEPFWTTQEIAEYPELLDATASIFACSP